MTIQFHLQPKYNSVLKRKLTYIQRTSFEKPKTLTVVKYENIVSK